MTNLKLQVKRHGSETTAVREKHLNYRLRNKIGGRGIGRTEDVTSVGCRSALPYHSKHELRPPLRDIQFDVVERGFRFAAAGIGQSTPVLIVTTGRTVFLDLAGTLDAIRGIRQCI
jgi:hypothetical protein